MMDYFVSFLTTLITNIICFQYFDSHYDWKFKNYLKPVYIFIITGIIFYINLYKNVSLNFLFNFIIFTTFFLIYKVKEMKNIILGLLFYVFLCLLDILCFQFTKYLIMLSTNVDWLQLDKISIELSMILESLTVFISYHWIDRFLNKKRFYKLNMKDYLFDLFLSFISFLICFGLTMFSFHYNDSELYYFAFITTIFILIFNVIYSYIDVKISNQIELENELNVLKEKTVYTYEYYKKVESMERENSLFIHDIRNHMQTLQTLIDHDDPKAEIYFEQINEILDEQKNYFKANNKVLEVLINEKIKEAKKSGIQIDVDYDQTNIDFISEFDIVTIFGNIIDNAIEAVENVDEKIIKIIMKQKRSYFVIQVINSYNKDMKKEDHKGIGLSSVEKSVHKYDGNMQIEKTEDMFKISIFIEI